jgi:hypothetical protein
MSSESSLQRLRQEWGNACAQYVRNVQCPISLCCLKCPWRSASRTLLSLLSCLINRYPAYSEGCKIHTRSDLGMAVLVFVRSLLSRTSTSLNIKCLEIACGCGCGTIDIAIAIDNHKTIPQRSRYLRLYFL